MRIAFFTTRMMLGYGVDLTVHEVASRLATTHGCEVDVWTPTSDGTYDDAPYALREIIVYGTRYNRVLPFLEFNAWRALRGLKRQLADSGEHYDVVVSCTHPYYSAGQALDVPQVFWNFGNVPTTGFSWRGKANWAWLDFSERHLHKPRSARIVSISNFLHGQQSHDAQHGGRVVYLGGDHYFPATTTRESFRQHHGIPADAVVLGYCGRLHRDHPPYKGTGVVLDIGTRIAEQIPRACLVMCGIGSPEDAAWVRSTGAIPLINLPPEEMPGFYASLDIYLCASQWEGFNLPIVEAAWHGVPAVAYAAGAHSEHVTQVLVQDGDADLLHAKALELVENTGLRHELGKAAQKRAAAFSWDNTTARFHAVLREVVL